MTFQEIQTKFEALGFKFEPSPKNDIDYSRGLFWRRITTRRPCLTNEKDTLFVRVFDNSRQNSWSFEVEIVGEYAKDIWTKLLVYSISEEDIFEKIDSIEKSLIKAWEAMS